MIDIRPNAQKELHRLLNNQTKRHFIHLAVASGGCLDWTYRLTLSETRRHQEETAYSIGGLTVVVPNQAIPYLKDLTIDYAEDLMGGGFRFLNPQAQQTCGCGNSFALTTAPHPILAEEDCTKDLTDNLSE
jgi:iron-sulfur cluster assembly protein